MHALKVDPRKERRSIDGAAGLAGLDAEVRRVLPPALYHYLAGASDDEATHARNLRAFRELAFVPNVLVDVSQRSLARTLFGVESPVPFGIAPMGMSRLIAPDGDVALARAAADAGIPFILSGASLTPMEDVRAAGATSWFQAYVPGEPDRISPLLDRVEAAGFETLVITADTAVHPKHERAARHGFRSPVRPSVGLPLQGLSRPGWLRRILLRDRLAALKFRFENMDSGQGPPVFSATLARDIGRRDALSWSHIDAVRRRWKGKLVIKGIMAAGDALMAEKAGVDGIIISNHGGRQLDCAASSLAALERIAERGLKLTLMHDGGIRRGGDVLKALKLGADFVFVGRPMLMAAAIGGRRGAVEAIALLAEEIDIAMALLGIDSLASLAEVELLRDPGALS